MKRQTSSPERPVALETPTKTPTNEAEALALLEKMQKEMSDLRSRLSSAKDQIATLNARTQQKENLASLNFRELLDRVREEGRRGNNSRAVSAAENGPGCLVEVRLANLTEIIATQGDRASAAALARVSQMLAEHIREDDTVGRLGTGTFGVVLAFADPTGVARKVSSLCDRIAQTPCEFEGKAISLQIAHRIVPLDQTD